MDLIRQIFELHGHRSEVLLTDVAAAGFELKKCARMTAGTARTDSLAEGLHLLLAQEFVESG